MFKCIFYALFSFFRIRNFVGKHALVSILAVNVLSVVIFCVDILYLYLGTF